MRGGNGCDDGCDDTDPVRSRGGRCVLARKSMRSRSGPSVAGVAHLEVPWAARREALTA